MSVPNGAACWICLDAGPDVHGRPLVRDCSCRGDSAGFVHVSCLVQYAKQKSTEHIEKGREDMRGFRQPWNTCFNCNQPYRRQLSLDMSHAFVLFAKKNYDYPGNESEDQLKVIDALRNKIDSSIHVMFGDHKSKSVDDMAESDIKEMLNKVEHLKKTARMASWIHEPRESTEYRNYKLLRENYEAFAYCSLGVLYSLRNSNHDLRIAIEHYKRALTIDKILGIKDEVVRLELAIATFENTLKEDSGEEGNEDVNSPFLLLRNSYEYARKGGEDSVRTVRTGMTYARALWRFRHCRVEAERLMIKLTARSRRVHGPEHEITKFAELELEQCKIRIVRVMSFPPPCIEDYQLLRYENDGANCVVKGPITEPRDINKEETCTITSSRIIPVVGSPVTCHGLKNALGLNGKLGDVRRISSKGEVRCAVHFEDKSLKPASVKPENLWVVIELPQKEIK